MYRCALPDSQGRRAMLNLNTVAVAFRQGLIDAIVFVRKSC